MRTRSFMAQRRVLVEELARFTVVLLVSGLRAGRAHRDSEVGDHMRNLSADLRPGVDGGGEDGGDIAGELGGVVRRARGDAASLGGGDGGLDVGHMVTG